MLGIVLVAHNDLAESMKKVAEHVVGPLPEVACISVFPEDDIELKRQEIQKAILHLIRGAKQRVLKTEIDRKAEEYLKTENPNLQTELTILKKEMEKLTEDE